MAIAGEDLVAYASVNRPEDDDDAAGGAIDEKTRVHFFSIPVPAPIHVVSTSASDTAELTLKGRTLNGDFIEGTVEMVGTDPIAFNESSYAYLLKAELDADAVGTITFTSVDGEDETVIAVIPPGERGFTSLFYKAASDPLSEVVRYDKFFWKNTHATEDLRGVLIVESADPEDVITHAPALAKDDSTALADRTTAPSTVVFRDLPRNIPNTNLEAGEAIGVWLKQTLPGGRDQFFSTYVSVLMGTDDEE